MKERILFDGFRRVWWMPLIVGLVALGLGIFTFICPKESIPVLAYIFAGALCGIGLVELCYSTVISRSTSHWGWSMVIGLLDLACGIWMYFLPPEQLAVSFMWISAFLLIFFAIEGIAESAALASHSAFWMVWMILLLIATFICAWIFISNPIMGGVLIWLWLGVSLVTYGVYRISMAFMLRSAINSHR